MKVVAFNGSARPGGNTSQLVDAVFEPLTAAGHDCEQIRLAGLDLHGCTACNKCIAAKDGRCHGPDDDMNGLIAAADAADAVIVASPTYFADVSAETKALIDRLGYVSRSSPEILTRKVGAAVVVARRGGAIHTFDTINHLFMIAEMVVPGSSYWNIAYGRVPGEVEGDEEGMRTMRRLGENLAWLLERLA